MQDRVARFIQRVVLTARDVAQAARGERGVTAAEYAILAVGIVIVVGGAVLGFSPFLVNAFTDAGITLTSTQASLGSTAR
jgi:Flp pilus assembly pilin Flp